MENSNDLFKFFYTNDRASIKLINTYYLFQISPKTHQLNQLINQTIERNFAKYRQGKTNTRIIYRTTKLDCLISKINTPQVIL